MIIAETPVHGILVDIPDLQPWMIQVEDIACSLSKACRYNGNCRGFYSVAEHSVHVASVLPSELKLYGLLHDAAEGYMGDLVRPFKHIVPDVRQIEQFIAERIYRKYLHRLPTQDEYNHVRTADDAVLITEAKMLLKSKGSYFSGLATDGPADVEIKRWEHCEAEQAYLKAWFDITRNMIV